jgi:hypothetical protein
MSGNINCPFLGGGGGCNLVSHTEGKHKLRVLKNRVLRKIFGPKKQKMKGGWTNTTMKSFIICTHHAILLR